MMMNKKKEKHLKHVVFYVVIFSNNLLFKYKFRDYFNIMS